MKRFWPRFLSAFSTLAVGLVAGSVARFVPAPEVKVQPPCGALEVKAQPTPVLIPEITQPPPSPGEATQAREETMLPHPVSISPYEIKRLVDENKRAFRRHQGADLELEPIWKRLNISGAPLVLPSCNGDCDSRISTIELDGKPGNETLLILCINRSFECRYLIFKQPEALPHPTSKWTLLGYVDAYMRWSDPAYRVMRAGRNRWLAIRSVSGHGSAFGSGGEDWYEVSERGVTQVLSYQTGLFVGFQNPEVNRTVKAYLSKTRGDVARVVLQMSTSYQGLPEFGDLFPLFTSTRKATFIKRHGMAKFVIDRLHSAATEQELDPHNGSEPVTPEDFLKHNYRELTRLAARGNAKQREWLRNYLGNCDESVEKQSLLTALGGEQP